jgi:hypothetical protein
MKYENVNKIKVQGFEILQTELLKIHVYEILAMSSFTSQHGVKSRKTCQSVSVVFDPNLRIAYLTS